MSFAKVMEFIAHIEDKCPVADWTVDNLHVWPLIRVSMAYSFMINISSKPADNIKITNISRDTINYAGQGHRRKENLIECRADAVFLSLTDTARVKVGDSLHDSLCNHLMQLLEKKNISSLHMGLSSKYDLEQASNTKIVDVKRYIDSTMDYINPVKRQVSNLYGLDIFNKELACFLESNNVIIPLYDIDRVKQMVIGVRNTANFFNLVFNRVRPALGFVSCYYGQVGMAFNLACRENNIKSFDLQHGHQTDFHFAYANWNNVPSQGYELLSDYFWCWGKKEADIINKWSSSIKAVHKPIIGGNPWYEAVKGYIAKDFYDKVDTLNSLCNGKLNVLYTHQASYGLDDWIIDAVESSPQSWFWWIRLHPRIDDFEKSMIVDKLNKCRNRNFDINVPTAIPLPILFNNMDVHVTGFSSCITEATVYGLFSVVTHFYGIELYSRDIEEGQVVAALNKEDLINAIMLQYSRRNGAERINGDNSKFLSSAVDKIVSMVQKSKHYKSNTGLEILDKGHRENLSMLYTYLNIVYSDKMYHSIIDSYKDNDTLPALYFVAKAYKSLKNENIALKYFQRVIQKLNHYHNNIENYISAMQLSDICIEILGIALQKNNNVDQRNLCGSIFDLCHNNNVFCEVYISKLFQVGYYNQIVDFKDFNQPETDYYVGRAYKSLLMYEESQIYLSRYISAFENNGINKNLIISDKNFAVSAYFHMGEMCYLQLINADAYDWFIKCKMLSETIHIKAEEYLNKLGRYSSSKA